MQRDRFAVFCAATIAAAAALAAACTAFSGNDQNGADAAGASEAGDASSSTGAEGATLDDGGATQSEAAVDTTPLVIAVSGDYHVIDLVTTANDVLWTTTNGAVASDPGILNRCPKTGCGSDAPTPVLATAPFGMGSLASNGGVAYASVLFGGAKVVQVQSNGTVPITALAGHARFDTLRMSGMMLFAEDFSTDGGSTRDIWVWDGAQASTPIPTLDLSATSDNVTAMAVTNQYVYLAVTNNSGGKIWQCGRQNCATWKSYVFGTVASVLTMTAWDDMMLFTDGQGFVTYCHDADCGSMDGSFAQLSDATDTIQSITAVDGVLYMETAKGDLRACTLPACNDARLLVHEKELAIEFPQFGHTVFADATYVYYAAIDRPDAGTPQTRIMRIPK